MGWGVGVSERARNGSHASGGEASAGGALTSVSPGTTGFLNLHPSMPPKKKFSLGSSGSIIAMPPTCARASTMSTPGMIGL